MKIKTDPMLFWFLKEGSVLNLDEPASADLYVQQVISHGRAQDVKNLLRTLRPNRFAKVFQRIKPFLPIDVKHFWEDFLAAH